MTLDEAIIHCEEVADKCDVTDGNIKCANEHRQLAEWLKDYKRLLEQELCENAISRQAAIEGMPSIHQKYKWETCFECPLSHGCPKIKGCTNEQAIEYASKIPNDCPLSVQSELKTDGDAISRQVVVDYLCTHCPDNSECLKDCDDIKNIKIFPSVMLQQKIGHWIHFATSDDCSECGWSTGKYISPSKYCPNCGAKMEVKE